MAFEEDYPDIKVEYIGLTAPNFWPRVSQERAGGPVPLGPADRRPGSQVFRARDEGILTPLRPILMLPEVTDGSKWLEGLDGLYADLTKEYVIAFFAAESITQFVNRDVLSERDLPPRASCSSRASRAGSPWAIRAGAGPGPGDSCSPRTATTIWPT